ncbi:Mum2p NDAI_0A07400 [Naumovozyma dairenensis CBS 421]|uniref:Uncharacterized protein n=1 Tax=Naumovozyma dairenensis (strain ATCC 10597 / BCRC 20456 / CBS 421 / NBRC 0211 / NRRL Y-12639) TaxID=1071378 RepID=G0W506_NAUDC|nr:hypothetical protein NDAI_0A07400 [Naumovozyma dairenensis CBS 421]CCD22894.1 hypothetical protein NDAI_0A07400 [Naumovozyma dairenensis CBS 421]
MNYTNYLYDPNQGLESAFSNLTFNNNNNQPFAHPPFINSNKTDTKENRPDKVAPYTTIPNNTHLQQQQHQFNQLNATDQNYPTSYAFRSTPNYGGMNSSNNNYWNSNNISQQGGNIIRQKTKQFDKDPSNQRNSSLEEQKSLESLKEKLSIKDIQVGKLDDEIQHLKSLLGHTITYNDKINESCTDDSSSGDTFISANLEKKTKELVEKICIKDRELKELNDKYEELYLKVTMSTSSNSITKNGRYDVETMMHKMIIRFETLSKENDDMARMLSYGRSKEIDVELLLLDMENAELREKIQG